MTVQVLLDFFLFLWRVDSSLQVFLPHLFLKGQRFEHLESILFHLFLLQDHSLGEVLVDEVESLHRSQGVEFGLLDSHFVEVEMVVVGPHLHLVLPEAPVRGRLDR